MSIFVWSNQTLVDTVERKKLLKNKYYCLKININRLVKKEHQVKSSHSNYFFSVIQVEGCKNRTNKYILGRVWMKNKWFSSNEGFIRLHQLDVKKT